MKGKDVMSSSVREMAGADPQFDTTLPAAAPENASAVATIESVPQQEPGLEETQAQHLQGIEENN